MMYERFTDRARVAMQLANQEAQRWNAEFIGPEHVLLGLIKEGTGKAAQVLQRFDVDLRKIRLETEKLLLQATDKFTMGVLPKDSRAKKVIEFAMLESQKLGHKWIGTEHLLLGLLADTDGAAVKIFKSLGLTRDTVRTDLLLLLQKEDVKKIDSVITPNEARRLVTFDCNTDWLSHFAASALSGLLGSQWPSGSVTKNEYAKMAFDIAVEMMNEQKKRQG